ncbi:hypothetical protein [Burkholderia mallei]|uniref:Uncharacterized protein n=1 Tax=Burkholderia mallei (strain NCTC 10229) TaxID=412022 RepID=A2S6Q1_BURM9|nr:hypothetical protein [Burkholderia mallei]ABM51959.1 hypothetical protein BMASAVP1_A3408 [Burkholderia mallei SAVP1]ABN01774.1 hypothetical protein BMA10229_A1640 [Burkholderia mallei NCTC 10229]ABO04728.1 conserved hypothetical protein [Burkholderia mallei NCTC 10247]EDK54454.1 hypothetical protein BMAFMH_B0343 [Burkholderia mallei FMH]EDK59432.1 hypothetical protein BMAJHU_B0335 [Burkholderia mallei JHU]
MALSKGPGQSGQGAPLGKHRDGAQTTAQLIDALDAEWRAALSRFVISLV